MASGNTTIEPTERLERSLTTSSQSVFQGEEGLRLLSYPVLPVQQLPVGDSSPKTRQFSGFIDEKMFLIDRERYFKAQETENRRVSYGDAVVERDCEERRNWTRNGNVIESSRGGGLAEEDDIDEHEDDDDEDDGGGDSKISTKMFKSSGDPFSTVQIDKAGLKQHATTGLSSSVNHQQGKDCQFQNVLPISAISRDGHCVRVVNVSGTPTPQTTDTLVIETGSASTLWKDAPLSESVRSILSDPSTGELMDDAVIFPCGHSFGAGGFQLSLQKKACHTCSLPITEDLVHRNLTLRAAVAAFRREEYDNRSLKRRRDRFEEKADFSDSNHMNYPRSRGLQFPFVVGDRVMIVGNKRTPERFVGREAIIMSQCLNGWYVVKTLDNAESVKLQYRSLAKVP